ncbi:RDD family protein [Alteromonas flava]|uniref:RDD family protein n=1 Tax=Alteromonas flava TaxID=2048003 RepID=UPI000C2917B0|nr:RDD family protein [Alteromonas flava]
MQQPDLCEVTQPDSDVTQSQASKPERDDKNTVTPYAFGIADHLLGLPIASPTRRLLALLIDLFCVVILSSLNALFLAGFTAVTFLRTNIRLARQRRFRRTRIVLSVVIAILMFAVIYGIVEAINEQTSEVNEGPLTGTQAIATGALMLAWNSCSDLPCKQELVDDYAKVYADSELSAEEMTALTAEFLANDETLTSDERAQLARLAEQKFATAKNDLSDQAGAEVSDEDSPSTPVKVEPEPVTEHESEGPLFSVIETIEAVAKDLGIGVGWAALYFSAFPTIWQGATPGKRLMGIYVIRIDGRIPTLWESFGRYGGYGAGLATGLMGFLQVYWDPNRQAIQDKISETLVLRRV